MTDLYIDNATDLANLCDTLRQQDYIAIDTEFLREKTYYPKLCLIQVANDDVVACVDPLAIDDLSPLLDVLFDSRITKVLHAAHQDLEILFQMRDSVPAPIFDTQVAATLLGHRDQIGYGALVQAELKVELDKGQARTDWCHRPLDPEQLKYAADDVRYLREIYKKMAAALAQQGRSDWLQEDFDRAVDPATYVTEPDDAWKRLKGAGRLKGVQLAVLQKLAAWREQEAIRADKPRRWIIKDEPLLDMAKIMPKDQGRIARIRGLEDRTAQRHGKTLLDLIEAGRQTPKEAWPTVKEGPRLGANQDEVVDVMMAVLRARCSAENIAPPLLANRRDLERLLLGERDLPLTHGWRRAIAGEALLKLLDGQLALRIEDGLLVTNELEPIAN